MNAAAKPKLVRGLAVLFLLFMLVDIASPPACCENAELVSAARSNSAHLVAAAADQVASTPTSSQSGSEQAPDRNCCDEDCCLFCAHMLPANALATEFSLALKTTSFTLNESLIPSPLLDATYHPPRFL
jgi:hypothetical protein